MVANPINYLFGQSISKQIALVKFDTSNIIMLASGQFNTGAYIGEINPIIRTDPSTIIFSGNTTNLDISTTYQLDVSYSTGMINHNYDIILTMDPNNATGST